MTYIADDVRSIAARLKEIEAERKPVQQGKQAAPEKPVSRPDWRNSGSAPSHRDPALRAWAGGLESGHPV